MLVPSLPWNMVKTFKRMPTVLDQSRLKSRDDYFAGSLPKYAAGLPLTPARVILERFGKYSDFSNEQSVLVSGQA